MESANPWTLSEDFAVQHEEHETADCKNEFVLHSLSITHSHGPEILGG